MLEKIDIENPEPKYFLPTIPTILLNGVEGVAVGFATKILPYNLEDIKNYIISTFNQNESLPELKPYYRGYTGKISLEGDKWVMHGIFKIINTTTIKITELPIAMDREKYLKVLSKLIDKDLITSFKDKSSSGGWNITIRLKRKSSVFKNPEKHLKLTQILSENITTIDEKGKLKLFKDVYELIDYFINFRMSIYTDRKKWMINFMTEENEFIMEKIKFIKKMCSINFKKMDYVEIVECMTKIEINKDIIKKCMAIPVYNLNLNYINKMKDKIIENKKDIKFYKKVSEKELYITDLENI